MSQAPNLPPEPPQNPRPNRGLQERLAATEKALKGLWEELLRFPWRNTALTLLERFREDRLGVTASSLTFTTTISLVPLFTVGLAVFSAFPMFAQLQDNLQRWLMSSLVPEHIARPVLANLNQFAAQAGKIGWVGALLLLVSALALILTIDRKLNDIWRVRQTRSLTHRVLVYWAVLTLGPLLLAASLSATAYALKASSGVVGGSDGLQLVIDLLQFGLITFAMAALFRHVPNTAVRWAHALPGGLFVASGLLLAKQLLAWYLTAVPTYSMVYGAFATVPILLIWIYLVWVIVLLGAVVSAYLPSLLSGIARRGVTPGWDFQLALELLGQLAAVRDGPQRGLGVLDMAQRLRVDPLQLQVPVEVLCALDWVGRLDENEDQDGGRYLLLADPAVLPVAALAERLLLPHSSKTGAFWQASHWRAVHLVDVLPGGLAAPEARQGMQSA